MICILFNVTKSAINVTQSPILSQDFVSRNFEKESGKQYKSEPIKGSFNWMGT